jgi:hypothetical protein
MSRRNKKSAKNKPVRNQGSEVTTFPIVSPDEVGMRVGALGVPGVEEIDIAARIPEKEKCKAEKDADLGHPPR